MTIDIDPQTVKWVILAFLIVCGAGVNEMGLIV
jgi:hypothetical protein